MAFGEPTGLTVSVPERVDLDEGFIASGNLYEADTGVLIRGQRVDISYNGMSLGRSYTGPEGDYSLLVSIPEWGLWEVKARFPGSAEYAASESRARIGVEVTPTSLAMRLAGPIVLGAVIMGYLFWSRVLK